MKVQVIRLGDNGDSTVGAIYINGVLMCGSIEDEERNVKIKGETRVPNGKYFLGLRRSGGFHNRYLKKYGTSFHKGMIAVYNAPNWRIIENGMSFQYVLIHTGNTDDHTAGCLLPNTTIDFKGGTGGRSGEAYKRIYPLIAQAIIDFETGQSSEQPTIEYIDIETGK